jgi:hypothetical protein
VKTLVIQSVELYEIYNFALRSFAKFPTVSKLQSSKVGYFETGNQFDLAKI